MNNFSCKRLIGVLLKRGANRTEKRKRTGDISHKTGLNLKIEQ
ncbi:hypothetical protein BN439_2524 [Erwinia amylovora Ea644]|nr:hypothetical protein BN439_2524 [Erwinia amylovora Ea644]CCP07607.1 hypothetical protein BN440_2589 [Erwinia amylovora MR1]